MVLEKSLCLHCFYLPSTLEQGRAPPARKPLWPHLSIDLETARKMQVGAGSLSGAASLPSSPLIKSFHLSVQ